MDNDSGWTIVSELTERGIIPTFAATCHARNLSIKRHENLPLGREGERGRRNFEWALQSVKFQCATVGPEIACWRLIADGKIELRDSFNGCNEWRMMNLICTAYMCTNTDSMQNP